MIGFLSITLISAQLPSEFSVNPVILWNQKSISMWSSKGRFDLTSLLKWPKVPLRPPLLVFPKVRQRRSSIRKVCGYGIRVQVVVVDVDTRGRRGQLREERNSWDGVSWDPEWDLLLKWLTLLELSSPWCCIFDTYRVPFSSMMLIHDEFPKKQLKNCSIAQKCSSNPESGPNRSLSIGLLLTRYAIDSTNWIGIWKKGVGEEGGTYRPSRAHLCFASSAFIHSYLKNFTDGQPQLPDSFEKPQRTPPSPPY